MKITAGWLFSVGLLFSLIGLMDGEGVGEATIIAHIWFVGAILVALKD